MSSTRLQLEEVFKNALALNSGIFAHHKSYNRELHIKFLCDLILDRQLEHSSEEITHLFTELKEMLIKPNSFSCRYFLLDQLKNLLQESNELPERFCTSLSEAQILVWGYELKLKNTPSVSFFWSGISEMPREKWQVFFEAIKLSGIIAIQTPATWISSEDSNKLLEIIRQNNIRRCLNKDICSLKSYIFYSMFRHMDTVGRAISSSDPNTHADLLSDFQQSFSEWPGLTGPTGTLHF